MSKPALTQKRLKELLHYDPLTGLFVWLVSPSNNVKSGNIAGNINKSSGYVQVMVDGKSYQAHRLACLFMLGYFPEHDMDHKKGIRHDNRWSHIIHASHACNMQNQKVRSDNTSGIPGVYWHKKNKRWMSCAMIIGKYIYLGVHETKLEAALARLTWEANCDQWKCNHRGELVKAIKLAWPQFNKQSISNVENN